MTASDPRRVRIVLRISQSPFDLDKAFPDGEHEADLMQDGEEYELPFDFEDAILRKMEEEEENASSEGAYEMTTSAEYSEEDGRVTFSYRESELTGMEGTVTQIVFDRDNPRIVSILRSGSVKSAFVLEEGRRHTSAYETPYLPFEVCVYARSVVNTVELPPPSSDTGTPKGEIRLDYVVEIRGMDAQRTRISIKIG